MAFFYPLVVKKYGVASFQQTSVYQSVGTCTSLFSGSTTEYCRFSHGVPIIQTTKLSKYPTEILLHVKWIRAAEN